MKNVKTTLGVIGYFLVGGALYALLFLTSAQADVTSNQGAGNPGALEWFTTGSARRAGKTTEVLVSNAGGGTAVPTTALTQRKSIELQNLGPNAIFCTVDGTAPVVNKARQIAANGTWALDVGPAVVLTCIAATAAQVTGAATIATEVR